MQYRKFKNLGLEVSALGFGAMRLPIKGEDSKNIDEEEAIKMIRHAVDSGVNYIDTAWPYHGGESEKVVGKALQDGYRDKVNLATKFTWPWMERELGLKLKNKEDREEYLNRQLKRLQTDHIDFYLLHGLGKERWDSYKEEADIIKWLEDKKEEGKIKHIGFSFHDDFEAFKYIIDDYDGWEFCQIQYNYLDTEYQAGRKGLKYAAEKDVSVVVMEPLRGGQLAEDPPEGAQEILSDPDIDRSPADLALQWLWNQPEVTTVLSGMSTMEQVEENLESADNSGVDILSKKELAKVKELARVFRGPIQCTACNYCMPCPNGVQIPKIFKLYNNAHVYDNYEENKERYFEIDEEKRAGACVNCGVCEEACPQNLGIMSLLKKVADYFGE
ncbi:MAG: aldo/keto reductase [Bacillota bacterium]